MKKRLIALICLSLLILPFISSLNIEVEQRSEDVAMIKGLNQPAIFDLDITNLGSANSLTFYNYFGSDMFPTEPVLINAKETKNVQVGIYPRGDLKQVGKLIFDLFVKGKNDEQIKTPLIVRVINLNEAFEVGAQEFKPDSNTVTVYVKNLANFNFMNLDTKLKSSFFNVEKEFSLAPYQKATFEIELNKEDFQALMAGIYNLDAEISVGDLNTQIQGTLKFSEKDIVTSSQDEYGVIIHTRKISKINEGNVISQSSTVLKKNIISRLFTTFSPEPNIVERKGFSVYYTWQNELKPGESVEIVVKTNWLLPLLAIFLIISIVILTKQFSKTSLDLKKKVNFVRAKGGEFALKVSVIVSVRKYVEKVNIIDRLPPLVKLHERFGGEMPKKIDEKLGRLEWSFDKLQEGETRIISYIIYSKVGVLGKFILPTTTAIYERDGEVHEAESNHAFFIADQPKKSLDD
jgi:hypothetical protein